MDLSILISAKLKGVSSLKLGITEECKSKGQITEHYAFRVGALQNPLRRHDSLEFCFINFNVRNMAF